MVRSSQQNGGYRGRILVLGLGNLLLKDEGVGVHVVQELQKRELGGGVEVIDGGTSGLDILLLQESPYKLVVIDAMKGGNEPGTVYKSRLKADELDRLGEIFSNDGQSTISLHQVGLVDSLLVASKTGCAPDEVTVIGVEPGEIDGGLELTEQVEGKIPEIISTVLEEIKDAVH